MGSSESRASSPNFCKISLDSSRTKRASPNCSTGPLHRSTWMIFIDEVAQILPDLLIYRSLPDFTLRLSRLTIALAIVFLSCRNLIGKNTCTCCALQLFDCSMNWQNLTWIPLVTLELWWHNNHAPNMQWPGINARTLLMTLLRSRTTGPNLLTNDNYVVSLLLLLKQDQASLRTRCKISLANSRSP